MGITQGILSASFDAARAAGAEQRAARAINSPVT
jgi:hypothetical protein